MVKMNKKKLMECKNFADIINVAKSLPQDASLVKFHDFMEVRIILNIIQLKIAE